jgi:hypothetical protein
MRIGRRVEDRDGRLAQAGTARCFRDDGGAVGLEQLDVRIGADGGHERRRRGVGGKGGGPADEKHPVQVLVHGTHHREAMPAGDGGDPVFRCAENELGGTFGRECRNCASGVAGIQPPRQDEERKRDPRDDPTFHHLLAALPTRDNPDHVVSERLTDSARWPSVF